MNMKKMISVCLIFALCISVCSVMSFASEETITFEEYEAAIVAEYAKYGIEGGVYEPESPFYCTREMLESDLKLVRQNALRQVRYEAERYRNDDIIPMNFNASLRSMYTNVTCTERSIFNFSSGGVVPCGCTIDTTVVFVVDLQNDYILEGKTPSLEVVSGMGIDDWVELVSHSHDIDNNRGRVITYISCKLKEVITLGTTTSWTKFNHDYYENFFPV